MLAIDYVRLGVSPVPRLVQLPVPGLVNPKRRQEEERWKWLERCRASPLSIKLEDYKSSDDESTINGAFELATESQPTTIGFDSMTKFAVRLYPSRVRKYSVPSHS